MRGNKSEVNESGKMMSVIMKRITIMCLWFVGSHAVRIQSIEVPKEVAYESDARLKCWVDPWPGPLYSVAWWKDGRQFYRAAVVGQRGATSLKVFEVDGMHVESGGVGEVWVRRVGVRAAGTYTCEAVADFPTFTQHTRSAHLSVLVPPATRPIVWGYRVRYRVGEVLRANCTVLRTHPRPAVAFSINGEEVEGGEVEVVEVRREEDYTTTLTTSLSLTLTPQHFRKKAFNLTCLANIGSSYSTNTSIRSHLAKPGQYYVQPALEYAQTRPHHAHFTPSHAYQGLHSDGHLWSASLLCLLIPLFLRVL